MIRDRLLVGIRDATLSQQLQLDAELTLEKAKKRIWQKEQAVGEQQRRNSRLQQKERRAPFLQEAQKGTAPAQEPRKLGQTKSHAYTCHTYYEGVYLLWKRATPPRKMPREKCKLPSV